jgi:hypothetical protein
MTLSPPFINRATADRAGELVVIGRPRFRRARTSQDL